MRLFSKLLLSFFVVVLVGVLVVSYLANQETAREAHGVLFQVFMTTQNRFAH